jgi:hypothetical protein
VYHLGFFRSINPAATTFAVMFLAEAALFGWATTRRGAMRFRARRNLATAAGAALMLYALVLYPALGHALGHRYPTAPTFGLPCPTTIFTLGLLLWAEPPARWTLVIVPVAWAALGTVAAARLGMLEDYGLPVAAIVAIVVLVVARREAAAGRAFTGRAPTALT